MVQHGASLRAGTYGGSFPAAWAARDFAPLSAMIQNSCCCISDVGTIQTSLKAQEAARSGRHDNSPRIGLNAPKGGRRSNMPLPRHG